MRALSTFRIFPRSGRIAWNARLRPCLAEPPALGRALQLGYEDTWRWRMAPVMESFPTIVYGGRD
jgi:hypothetical protein